MPQFDISFYFSQFFWMTVCLCVLIYAFKNVFVPRMNDIISNRDEYIDKYNKQAENIEKDVLSLKKNIENNQKATTKKTKETLEKAIKNGEEIVNSQLSAIKKEHLALINGTRSRLREEMKNIEQNSKTIIDEIAHKMFDKLFLSTKNT